MACHRLFVCEARWLRTVLRTQGRACPGQFRELQVLKRTRSCREKRRSGEPSVRFQIPGALRDFAGGRSEMEVEHPSATVQQALSALWTVCPGMRDRVVTEQGQVRQHINIFVGDENIRYTGGLSTPVTAQSVISIVPAVS